MSDQIKRENNIFGIIPGDNCSCDWTDYEKSWYIAGWAIGIVIYIFLLMNSFIKWIVNKIVFYLLFLSAAFLTITMSGIIYFDACQCKDSRYSKWFSSGYLGISIIILIFMLLFKRFRSPPEYTPQEIAEASRKAVIEVRQAAQRAQREAQIAQLSQT